MRQCSRSLFSFAILMCVSSSALAAQSAKTPLGKKMSAMNAAFKIVARQVGDASKNAETIAQLGIFERNATSAIALSPKRKAQVPVQDQVKFQSDYESEMKSMLTTVTKLRAALKTGRNADAVALVDSLKQQQRGAHREFRGRQAADSLNSFPAQSMTSQRELPI